MTHQPPPPPGARSERDRRLYFEHLTEALLARGMEGGQIGELVAELDDHVSLVGGDPVVELGPVSDLTRALAEATTKARPWSWRIMNMLLGVASGLTAAGIGALLVTQSDGARVLPLGIAVYTAVVVLAWMLIRATRENRLVGRSRVVRALWPILVLTSCAVLWTHFVGFAEVPVPALTALGLVLVAAPVAVMAGVWVHRWSRVDVPGRAWHLQRLDLGWWSRQRQR